MNWARYVMQVRQLPPRVTWHRAQRKVENRLKRDIGWLRARLLGTDISDSDFLRASDSRFPTIQTYLDHLAARETPRFFLDSGRRCEFVTSIRRCCPKAESFIIRAADRVCEHIFDLLGSGPTHLGERIDWHLDFKTGYRFDACRYYADIRPAPYPVGYDIKVPWELSRCQHFAWLGQAYWFTDDEKYATEFVAQVLDWIEQNPPQFGVNWACTMEVAIRLVNWTWGYYFLKGSKALTNDFIIKFVKSLLTHGRHIISNLENREKVTTNHYLADIVGLIHLGVAFHEFKEVKRWKDFGVQELIKEMRKQVYPDGTDFEASTCYHRLVLEFFFYSAWWAVVHDKDFTEDNFQEVADKIFGKEYVDRLHKMFEAVLYLLKPDSRMPQIGDNDSGQLVKLYSREVLDMRYLLALGAVFFKDPKYKVKEFFQTEEGVAEVVILYGPQGLDIWNSLGWNKLKNIKSKVFPDSGWYVMRDDKDYAIISCGSNGQNGNGGHAHNDKLSYEFVFQGKQIIVDPGTYVYTSLPGWRYKFRGTAYHNTIVVDGEEMNRFDWHSLFSMQNDVIPTVNKWFSNDDYDFLDAQHNGYHRLTEPITHRRQLWFNKADKYWAIRDIITGRGIHKFHLYFHFSPMEVTFVDGESLILQAGKSCESKLIVIPAELDGISGEILDEWVSYSYGTKALAPVVRYSKVAEAPTEFLTLLLPGASHKDLPNIFQLGMLAKSKLDYFSQQEC